MIFSEIQPKWRHCVGCPYGDKLCFFYVCRFHRIADGQDIVEDVPRKTDFRQSSRQRQISSDFSVHGNR